LAVILKPMAPSAFDTERPYRDYRNRGKRPMDTTNEHLTLVRQEGKPYSLDLW
jgi:hypothetical protein